MLLKFKVFSLALRFSESKQTPSVKRLADEDETTRRTRKTERSPIDAGKEVAVRQLTHKIIVK